MHTRKVAPIGLVVFGTFITMGGCGADTIAIGDFPAALERAACKRMVLCGSAVDQAACEATTFFAHNEGLLTIVAAVKRGTVAYDASHASACIQELEADCAYSFARTSPSKCDEIFTGRVATGGVCVGGVECADKGDCVKPSSCVAACCSGTCQVVPIIGVGAPCAGFLDRCAPGAFCDRGTCAPELPVGSPCYGSGCVAPAVCLQAPDGSSETCTVLSAAAGAPCIPGANFDCGRSDERCAPATMRCIKLTPLGGACDVKSDCIAYSNCVAGICQVEPAAGEPCDFAANLYCQGDLTCNAGVCR